MPDTFGKRQRDEAKAKRRAAKEARRAARKEGSPDPTTQPHDLHRPEPTAGEVADSTLEPGGSDDERP